MLHMTLAQLAEPVAANDVQADQRLHFAEHQYCAICELPAVHHVQVREPLEHCQMFHTCMQTFAPAQPYLTILASYAI